MASIYSSKSTYGWQLRLDYTVSQSVANNKSTLSLALYIYDGTGESYNQAANSCYYTLQGTRTYNPYSYTDAQKNTWIKLGTKTVEVAHADDGTGSVTLSADWHSGFASQWTPASLSLSQSVTLPTIPRASTMTVSNGTLGTELNMTISRASSSFTHTITYTCGSASGTIVSKTTSTTPSWSNPPVALAAQDTKASAVTVTLTLDTYNGSTKIGSKAYTVKMTVPASVKPTVGTLSVSCPQEHVTTYGGYIQGKSTVEVAAPTVTLGQGSAIVSRQIKIGNTQTINAASGTSAVLQETGTVTITYTVTDERGRTGSNTTTITVQPYAAPQITTCTAVRCQQDGTEDAANGTYIKATWAASVSSLGGSGNSGTAKLYWRETGASNWTEVALSALSGNKILGSKSTSKSYELYVTVADSLGTVSRAITVRVASGTVLFATTPGMDGLSLGQASVASGKLGIGYDVEIQDDPLADWITAQGTDGMWTWRKWHSGIAECWGKVENLSTSGGAVQMNWSQTNGLFTVIDAVEATAWYGADASTRTARSLFITVSTNTEHCTLYLRNGDGTLPSNGTNFAVSIKAIGRWK